MSTSPPPGVAPADHAFTIDGPAGPIEAACDEPDAAAAPARIIAVVCHPLPTEGGSMHNKVVTMAARRSPNVMVAAGSRRC